MNRQFRRLWASYAVSAYGSGLAFGALPLIAVLVLDAGPAQVSALAAIGPAVGALLAVPLGPWMEFRRKRPVMITMDLVRFAVLMTIPIGYATGALTFTQLLIVSAVAAAAKIAFNAAAGAHLKALVPPGELLVANARFESTNWSSIAVGPPLGGAAIGLLGPVTTVIADAVSYLLSAVFLTRIPGREAAPPPRGPDTARSSAAASTSASSPSSSASSPSSSSAVSPSSPSSSSAVSPSSPSSSSVASSSPSSAPRALSAALSASLASSASSKGRGLSASAGRDLVGGWRHLLGHRGLRALFLNSLLVNGLIMATEPLLTVLMVAELGFPLWQYGLAFAVPCLGGLIGSRLARRVVASRGQPWVLRVVGTLRVVWLIGLAFVQPGVVGLVTVIVLELAIIICMSLFNPVLATYRLEHTPAPLLARTLTAWSISSGLSIAVLAALSGLLAGVIGPRPAIAAVGVLILVSPLLLIRGERL
ncbi:MFS transporter [Actinoplanes sp. CA-252034]|uniref:MFS transporter n=1 Tax=Actinoplanes sp. CA-252034 TaxID=3239906 RepID=UPI003D98200D